MRERPSVPVIWHRFKKSGFPIAISQGSEANFNETRAKKQQCSGTISASQIAASDEVSGCWETMNRAAVARLPPGAIVGRGTRSPLRSCVQRVASLYPVPPIKTLRGRYSRQEQSKQSRVSSCTHKPSVHARVRASSTSPSNCSALITPSAGTWPTQIATHTRLLAIYRAKQSKSISSLCKPKSTPVCLDKLQ